MKLELQSIDINEVVTGSKTYVEGGVLHVNTDELEGMILKDERIKSVDIDIVYPEDKARIVNILDVVQPRCKLNGSGPDFPGFIGKMGLTGKGKTRTLQGVSVLISNPCTKRTYSAMLDMGGLCSELSRYACMNNISISPWIGDAVDDIDFEWAVKIAGLKTAVYLARAAENCPLDGIEVYDLDTSDLDRSITLPRVAYYFQMYTPQHDFRGISDPCFYGTDVRNILPTIIHPNEILDGGIVGHNTVRALDTYAIQNHAIIKELYKHHRKDIVFAGVVCGTANMDPVARERKAMLAASLIKNTLGADGAILSKVHGGMPHVDLALIAEELENLDVKTAVHVQVVSSFGTLSDTLLFNSEKLDLIISPGATMERIKLKMNPQKILGGKKKTKIYCPDPIEQHAGDSEIDIEEFLIAGVHDHLGGANITVKEY